MTEQQIQRAAERIVELALSKMPGFVRVRVSDVEISVMTMTIATIIREEAAWSDDPLNDPLNDPLGDPLGDSTKPPENPAD